MGVSGCMYRDWKELPTGQPAAAAPPFNKRVLFLVKQFEEILHERRKFRGEAWGGKTHSEGGRWDACVSVRVNKDNITRR